MAGGGALSFNDRRWCLAALALGLPVMYGPTFWRAAHTLWASPEQAHGPLILAVAMWWFWYRRDDLGRSIGAGAHGPAAAVAWLLLLLGALMYAIGHAQLAWMLEIGSLIPVLAGALALLFGWPFVRVARFALGFLLFAIPLPGPAVDALTAPLKRGVSVAADELLYLAGYPVARDGVVISLSQYKLLIADACSGLYSMTSLFALAVLYVNAARPAGRLRNAAILCRQCRPGPAAGAHHLLRRGRGGPGLPARLGGHRHVPHRPDPDLPVRPPAGPHRSAARRCARRAGRRGRPALMAAARTRAALVLALMLAAAGAGAWLKPARLAADAAGRIQLERIIPSSFAGWRIDPDEVPIPLPPDLRAALDRTYDQVLERTYVDRQGHRVMLSVDYARHSERYNLHRPEVCYPAQGFEVEQEPVPVRLATRGGIIDGTRLVARRAERHEPITYWAVVGAEQTHFGLRERLLEMRYGFGGIVPDGLLVRVSTIGAVPAGEFAVQEAFIDDLVAALGPTDRAVLLGASAADGARAPE